MVVAQRSKPSLTLNDMGLLEMWNDSEQRLLTASMTLFRQRKYVIKKYFGKISPRLFTGKEAQDSARQGKCGVFAWIVEGVHFTVWKWTECLGEGVP